MTVERTVTLNDLSPAELAELFCDLDDYQQAAFFASIRPIAAEWPGAGWCQQSYSIVSRLNDDGVFVLETLLAHFSERAAQVSA